MFFKFIFFQSLQQVAILHANQQIIEKETKQVKNELNKFYKEIENWSGLYNELNEKLMVSFFSKYFNFQFYNFQELGDVVNWAMTIEQNLKEMVKDQT